jgi:MYXO-CTERM domain-containing protein
LTGGFFNPTLFPHTGDQIRGYGFLHDGSVDTVFRFLHAAVFTFDSDDERRDMEAFVMAFDSNLAPIVGQQITLDSTNGAAVNTQIDLLLARARANFTWPHEGTVKECDLVVHGIVGGAARGYLYDGVSTFTPDRAAESPLSEAALRALATTPGQPLTFTCVPPGSGRRMGIDRDEDGTLDGDDASPATRTLVTIPELVLPNTPLPDGGVPDGGDMGPDAGDPGGGGGCSCDVAGAPSTSSTSVAWAFGLATIAWLARARLRARRR